MQNASSNGDFMGRRHVEAQPASAAGDFTWKLVPPALLATSWLCKNRSSNWRFPRLAARGAERSAGRAGRGCRCFLTSWA